MQQPIILSSSIFWQYSFMCAALNNNYYTLHNLMQNLFTGGECAPGTLAAQSNNFKRLVDMMMMGNHNPEKLMEMTQSGLNVEQQIMAREMIFQQMNKAWAMEEARAMSQGRLNDQGFVRQKAQHQMAMNNFQSPVNSQQHMLMREQMMAQTFMQAQMMQAQQHAHMQHLMQKENEMKMEEAFQKELKTEDEQTRIKNAASSMLDAMMDDPDPRFKNSQFLHFLKKINAGDVAIENNELVHKKDTVPEPSAQVTLDEASLQAQRDIEGLQKQFMASEQLQSQFSQMSSHINKPEESSEEYKKFMDDYVQEWQKRYKEYEDEIADPAEFDASLQKKYLDVLKDMDIDKDLSEVWRSATDMEEQQVYGDYAEKYVFSSNNPYLGVESAVPLAMQLMNKGRNNDAILALESSLQKDENDANTWRLLGKLLQENDQDQKSVPCFLNALKIEPENLDTLLSLGVSCTNILDEVKAMNYLKQWMLKNPKFATLNIDPNIIPDNFANQYSFQIEDIKKINSSMIQAFTQALSIDQNDPDLLQSLAVLHFIKREYDTSVDLFSRAGKLQPTNYTLWNRIGASLAHLGRPDEAIECYHKALEIRPNYVRAWVNLGISHGFKGLYEDAARFYLNGLSFRPDAKHLWAYLQTCFMSMQRYDLIKLIGTQDPRAFKEFDVIEIGDLPEPLIEYQVTNESHILRGGNGDILNKE